MSVGSDIISIENYDKAKNSVSGLRKFESVSNFVKTILENEKVFI
jgi:hypothetical protein